MKKDKTIRIKDPILRIIRNNLRNIIKRAEYIKFKELSEEIRKLKHIRNYSDDKEPTQEEKEQSHKLSIERDKFENALERSIIYCPECKRTDQDMRYFPNWAEWVCVDCYDEVVKRWEHAEKYHKESKERGW
jgi:hypothetical protein